MVARVFHIRSDRTATYASTCDDTQSLLFTLMHPDHEQELKHSKSKEQKRIGHVSPENRRPAEVHQNISIAPTKNDANARTAAQARAEPHRWAATAVRECVTVLGWTACSLLPTDE